MMTKEKNSSSNEGASYVERKNEVCDNSVEVRREKSYPCSIFYSIQAPSVKCDSERIKSKLYGKRSSLTPCIPETDIRGLYVTKKSSIPSKFEKLSVAGKSAKLMTRPRKPNSNDSVPSNLCKKRCSICNNIFEFPPYKVCIICQERFINMNSLSNGSHSSKLSQTNLFQSPKVSDTSSLNQEKNEFESATLNKNALFHNHMSPSSNYSKKYNDQLLEPSLNSSLHVTHSVDELAAFKNILLPTVSKKSEVRDSSFPEIYERNIDLCSSSLSDDKTWDSHVLNFANKDITKEKNIKNNNKNEINFKPYSYGLNFCELCKSVIPDFNFKFCKLCHKILSKSDHENFYNVPYFARDEILQTTMQDCETCLSQFNSEPLHKFCIVCHKLMSEFSGSSSYVLSEELSSNKTSCIDSTDLKFIVNDTKNLLQDSAMSAILNKYQVCHKKPCNVHLLDLCRICERENSKCLCYLKHTVCQPLDCFFETCSKVQKEIKSITNLLNQSVDVLAGSTLPRKKERVPKKQQCFYKKPKFKADNIEASSEESKNNEVIYLRQFLENSLSSKCNSASDAKRLLLHKSEAILHEMWHLENDAINPEQLLAEEVEQNVNLMKAVHQMASKGVDIPKHVVMYKNLPPP